MNPLALLFERPESWLLVIFLIVLLFGADRIPKAARSLGRSVSEFKKGVREGQEEEKKDAEKSNEEKKSEKPT
jgi:sec-independent protein translocase protein TatA